MSADGKQIAFVWNGEKKDNYDIYVQLVGDATPRRLTTNPATEYSPVWPPDALHIAFLRESPAGTEVIIIPSAGGEEKKLHVSSAECGWSAISRQYCGLAWSPDGKFLTIVDKESPQAPNSIFLFDIKTREKRELTTPPPGYDGKWIYFASNRGQGLAIWRAPANGGPPVLVAPKGWGPVESWDGEFVYYCGLEEGIWKVPTGGGSPLLVARNGSPPIFESDDGKFLYYSGPDTSIWKVPVAGGDSAHTFGSHAERGRPTGACARRGFLL